MKDDDFDVCIFCWRPRHAEVTHSSLDRPVPVCGHHARMVVRHEITAEELRERLKELREMMVLT